LLETSTTCTRSDSKQKVIAWNINTLAADLLRWCRSLVSMIVRKVTPYILKQLAIIPVVHYYVYLPFSYYNKNCSLASRVYYLLFFNNFDCLYNFKIKINTHTLEFKFIQIIITICCSLRCFFTIILIETFIHTLIFYYLFLLIPFTWSIYYTSVQILLFTLCLTLIPLFYILYYTRFWKCRIPFKLNQFLVNLTIKIYLLKKTGL
jgi:hypothetical protein